MEMDVWQLLEIPKKRRKMVKTHRMSNNDDGYRGVDLISDLPDEAINRIISFLSIDDLIQFSTVSKRSYAVKHLDFELFTEKKSVWPTYKQEEEEEEEYFSKWESFLNFEQHSIEQSHNKFIELNLDGTADIRHSIFLNREEICRLSGTIFSAEAQHIRFLKLRGFWLDCDGEEHLNLSCPSMVDFSLSHCAKFKTINLCGANLKRVELDSIHGLEKALHSPHLIGEYSPKDFQSAMCIEQRLSEISIHSYKSLKYLEIKNADIITDEWFQHHVSQLDFLETLILDSWKEPSSIYMSSNNLTALELRNCAKLLDIKIIALNLASFSDTFTGCLSPFNLLENLKLILEERFLVQEDVRISIDSLKILELKNYFKTLKNLEIKALNLESFTFHNENWAWSYGNEGVQFNLDMISSCINLTHIKLIGVDGLAYNFSGFPLLEKLELEACKSIEKLELYGGRCLKSLKLLDCTSLSQIEIEAPNLVSFMFRDSTQTLPSSLLLVSPPTLVPKLFLTASDGLITDLFRKSFRDFLAPFSFHNTVSLGCTSSEFHYKPVVKEEAEADDEDVLSYVSCPIKCWWRHYLTKVEMDNFEDLDERSSNRGEMGPR
ncbi:hypothetical protein FNV43_RR03922 [Rhamnella rubrinervis]|uniref:F-box domain-containing protein n=1 Tax=Rhamnella rubrinervis TaxID=2594499 RepID=A0A8K0HIM4_9ROSA|nr:hypothetical protein FNV43_RR03922 [Rhamnella rubrinervis]